MFECVLVSFSLQLKLLLLIYFFSLSREILSVLRSLSLFDQIFSCTNSPVATFSLSLFFWRARSVCYSIFCFSQETNELYHGIILCVCVLFFHLFSPFLVYFFCVAREKDHQRTNQSIAICQTYPISYTLDLI